jgi:uncharacterized protein YcbX
VVALYRYPIKSTAGTEVETLEFDERGVVGDRLWMLIDESGQFLSQRRFPRMSLIHPTLAKDRLTVDAPGMPTLEVPGDGVASGDGERVTATIWDDTVSARRIDPGVDRWFSEFLGVACSLVTMPGDVQRQVDTRYAPVGRTVGFADGFPVLVIGTASLVELNRRLREKNLPPVRFDRFRPNVVVATEVPHVEDTWRRVTGPGVALDIVKPCGRCAIVTVDQARGVRLKEPLATLSEYRTLNQSVMFGQNAMHDRQGRMNCNDALTAESL